MLSPKTLGRFMLQPLSLIFILKVVQLMLEFKVVALLHNMTGRKTTYTRDLAF